MKITKEKEQSISRFAEILDSLPERYVGAAYASEIAQATERKKASGHSGRRTAAFRGVLTAAVCLTALIVLVVGTMFVSARLNGGAGAWNVDHGSAAGNGEQGPAAATSPSPTEENVPEPITVTFDAAGGTGCPESIVVAYGEIPILPVPEREGYWFLGWDYFGTGKERFEARFFWEYPEMFRDCRLTARWLEYDPHGTVRFGSFDQDGSAENGAEPLEWFILDRSDGKVLLLSKYVIAAMPYNAMIETADGKRANSALYDRSDLRAWLLGEFADAAFSDDEKAKMIPAPADDFGNTDSVFLLSVSEAEQYLNGWREDEIPAPATQTALAAGLRLENIKDGKLYCWWWLRQEEADITGSRYGYVDFPSAGSVGGYSASNIPSSLYGVRPAIIVDETALGSVFGAE